MREDELYGDSRRTQLGHIARQAIEVPSWAQQLTRPLRRSTAMMEAEANEVDASLSDFRRDAVELQAVSAQHNSAAGISRHR
jgi:hypothetical protein